MQNAKRKMLKKWMELVPYGQEEGEQLKLGV
jgi:hypothetical protein